VQGWWLRTGHRLRLSWRRWFSEWFWAGKEKTPHTSCAGTNAASHYKTASPVSRRPAKTSHL